jgi:DNA invertase Pin-like site-specific DNA recombinase
LKASKKPLRQEQRHFVGYARVSTDDQSVDMQIEALKRYGVDPTDIYADQGKSGASLDKRDGLMSALKACRPAEHGREASVLVVWKMDRISRSLVDLMMLAEAMKERGVQIRSLTEPVDTTSSWGKLLFRIIGALAEFERDLTLERTHSGLEHARAQGRVGGAPRQFDDDKEREIATAYWQKSPSMSHRDHVTRLAKRYKVREQTIYNIRDRHPEVRPAGVPAPRTQRALAYEGPPATKPRKRR